VLVHLTSSLGSNVESRVLTELWTQLASTYGDIKFCSIRGDLCIEGYPEKNTPTILVYRDGDIKRQIITLTELNGPRTSLADLERLLLDLGAIKQNDVRLNKGQDDDESTRGHGIQSATVEDDDDWD
jgi:hypothetical protein